MFDLKESLVAQPNCLRFDIAVSEKLKGRWRFSVLEATRIPWSEFESRWRQWGDDISNSATIYETCRVLSGSTFFKGQKGAGVIVCPTIFGEISGAYPYFFTEAEIAKVEVRGNWQNYKYSLLKVRSKLLSLSSPLIASESVNPYQPWAIDGLPGESDVTTLRVLSIMERSFI